MKRLSILIFSLTTSFLNITLSHAQYECATDRDTTSNFIEKSYSYCNEPYNYLGNYLLDKKGVTKYDQGPIYTVNIKVHVMQYSTSEPRNYTEADTAFMRQTIEGISQRYTNLLAPTISVISDPLKEETDSRIRFRLESIDFIQDVNNWVVPVTFSSKINSTYTILNDHTIKFNSKVSGGEWRCIEIQGSGVNNGIYKVSNITDEVIGGNSYTTIELSETLPNFSTVTGDIYKITRYTGGNFNAYYTYHQNDLTAIHLYYVRSDDDCYKTGFGIASQNAFVMVTPGTETLHMTHVGDWDVGLIAHELGHCLGLPHTWYTQLYVNDIFQPDDDKGGNPCNNTNISNNIMGYNSCRTYFSPLQIAEMRRNLNTATKVKNTVAELYQSTNHDVIITEPNTVWEKHEIIGSNLIIESGASLIIKCKVHFSPDAKVIIKQGGKLIIDGGLLTNEYGDFWQGIQVYGTTNKNQFPENNPTYQGLLVIKNGGIIENAHKAVTNWHQDSWNEIGGVIQATDAVFRNNRRDVEFISYQNYNPNYSNKYRNLSRFTNTDFVTDDDFIEKGLTIQTHVTMWKVDGITFTNCHFSNDITANKNYSSSPDRGIYSIDAGYTVRAGCTTIQPIGQQCPTANLLKSSFSGFQTAIEATGSGTTESVLIQQSDILENIFGITISNLDNVSINRNDISMGDAGYGISLGIGAGIYDATGYIIEENNVLNNQGSGIYLGIGVSNSLSEDNRIYKNSLEDLTIGLIGQGVNHNSNYQKGLQFLCNKLTNNQTALNMNSDPINDGVRFYQGDFSPLKSAGNRFIGNALDIDNSTNSIVYIHNGGDTEPINYQGLVTLQYTSNVNSCPTSFGGGIIFGPILLALDSLNTELDELSTSYNDLNFTYTSLIDNGNTEDFKDNIELNWSSDAWLLRSKLLESSPYLSSEVLLEAAKQGVLPNGMLLEILLANPDATRGERFINELKTVTNNTFPEYMLDYVRGNYDNRTLRTEMEGQLSSIHSNLSSTRNWIKHLTKSKEEYNNQDRLEVSKLGSEIYNKVGLMDYYIEQGNFNKADSVLNSIENDKKYKDDLSMIENFGNYINFRSNLGTRNLAQLDSTEIAYLQTLAEHEGRVAGYAQNILCFFYTICYEKDLAFGNSQAKYMMLPPQNNQEELNNVLYNIKLYPNPANDYASIQWEIYDELKDANYRVVDLNGREQLSGVLGDNRGEQVLDTRKLKNGVYIIGIYNNNQLKVSKKLVIENQR